MNARLRLVFCPGWQSIQTEYYKGALRRTDWSDKNGKHKHVQVFDPGNRRIIDWDFDYHQYSIHPLNPPLRFPAAKPAPDSPVITIDNATTDTGEHRIFFGQTARY